MASSAEIQTDGRAQRSERSRIAIVRAMLDLITDGTPAPTAQQVADRADVGVRTVFRHFSDMEMLFAAMADAIWEEIEPLVAKEPQTGPLAERIEQLIERRVEIFEKISPYRHAAIAQRKRSAFIKEQHDRDTKLLRRDLKRWLPELELAAQDVADGIEMALSFEAWDRMRSDQKLSTKRAAGAVRRLITPLALEEFSPH